MSKVGIVYAKEVPMIKVKQVKEINGKGTPLHTVIQYWTSLFTRHLITVTVPGP